MTVELLTPDAPPTDPAVVAVPESVPELESVPVEPEPEVVSVPFPELTFVWDSVPLPVFPLGATLTGAAAEPAM